MIANPNKLWVKIFSAKCNCKYQALPKMTNDKGASVAWRGIAKAWE